MKNIVKFVKDRRFFLCAYIWLTIGIIIDVWYLLGPGRAIINSDMSAELILAKLLNDEGGIISKNWFYATELRVFQIQWVYRLWLIIIPNNWAIARALSALTLQACMAASTIFCFRKMNAGVWGVWCAGLLVWPISEWHFYYTVCNSYYVTFNITTMLTVGLIVGYIKSKSKARKCVNASALFLLAFVMGMNGIRELMILYCPMLVAAMCMYCISVVTSKESNFKSAINNCIRERSYSILALGALLAAGAGYLINTKLVENTYQLAVKHDDLIWKNAYFNLNVLVRDFFVQMGFQSGTDLFSIKGIMNVFSFVGMGMLLISIIRIWILYKNLEWTEKLWVVLLASNVVVTLLVFVFLGSYTDFYWLPSLPLAVGTIFIWIKNEKFNYREVKGIAGTIFIIAMSICSLCTVKKNIDEENINTGNKDVAVITEWLVDNGYTRGAATFWNSNIITEMTNGEIEMWTTWNFSENQGYEWLQNKNHAVMPEEEYFILTDVSKEIFDPNNVEDNREAQLVYVYKDMRVYNIAGKN